MRYSSFLSLLAGALPATTASAQSSGSPPPPQFTAILTGQINATYKKQAAGPFGTRIHLSASGGSLSNATTGEAVASILSFSDNGVTSNDGTPFPSAVMPLTWSADGHFASVSMEGVGNATTQIMWMYTHVETDSSTYSWMNGKFLIMQVDASQFPAVNITMYVEMN